MFFLQIRHNNLLNSSYSRNRLFIEKNVGLDIFLRQNGLSSLSEAIDLGKEKILNLKPEEYYPGEFVVQSHLKSEPGPTQTYTSDKVPTF